MSSQNGMKRDAHPFDTHQSQKPAKIRRALAACKNCRKQKTRCDHSGGAPCHRCKVLGLDCEFDNETIQAGGGPPSGGPMSMLATSPGSAAGELPSAQRMDRFESRMERMEGSIHALIAALNNNVRSDPANATMSPEFPVEGQRVSESEDDDDNITRPTVGGTDTGSGEHSPAPVEIIRGLASEFLDHQSPKDRNKYTAIGTGDDIVSKGIVSEAYAQELLDIFMKEYGKWIDFPPLPSILPHLRVHSPLLLSAAALIASRHLPPSAHLEPLVTSLFSESRRLLSLALLNVPRNVETLQAILILSVWSPLAKRETRGERTLSGGRTLDSWLVSGYGVMLGMTVIRFNDLTRGVGEFKGPRTPMSGQMKENTAGILQRLRVWNHLCLIHLHYSVGTRRPCILEPSLIERCRGILDVDGTPPSFHDQRMVAEILLYSKLYNLLQRVGTSDVRGMGTEEGGELQTWRENWNYLFLEDGHQYLEIGYYFAHLMLHAQALKLLDDGHHLVGTPTEPSPGRTPSSDISQQDQKKSHMSAISQLSTQILQRAQRVEVSELRHVTDIIYFIIAFAGVSLCRLLPSIPIFGSAKSEEYRSTLNSTITEGVEWLRTVAISEEHIASKFAEIIAGLHSQTLRRQTRREGATQSLTTTPTEQPANWNIPVAPTTTMGFIPPFPPTPTYLMESPTRMANFGGVAGGGYPPQQQGFGANTGGYDESYYVGLFPELMGHGLVDGGFTAGLGQGSGGFEDALGFWGFRNT